MERNTRRETGVPSAVSFSYALRGALPLLDHSTTLVVAANGLRVRLHDLAGFLGRLERQGLLL